MRGEEVVVLSPDIERLPEATLEQMLAAGQDVLECIRVLEKVDRNLVGELLRGTPTFYELEHYPPNDVYDADSHAQYYYHAHRGITGEHGHFHAFLRAPGMPAASPPWAGQRTDEAGDNAIAHLVAISMDSYGRPIGLFTTNRWVTDESWYPAEQVIAMLDRFRIDHADPSWPVNRWITAMIRLFRPQIEWLIRRRDEAVAQQLARHPGDDVFEDRRLEVTSELRIDIDEQLARVRRALSSSRWPLPPGVAAGQEGASGASPNGSGQFATSH